MWFNRYFPLLAAVSGTLALQLSNTQLSSSNGVLSFSETNEPVVFDTTSSKLDISFDVKHTRQPDQIFVKVSDQRGLETSFKPITTFLGDGVFKSKITLPYVKLPKVFQSEKNLDIHLIVASTDGEKYFEKIGSIELDDALLAKSTYTPAERYAIKPEIHHIFQSAPKTVSSSIALAFSALVVVALFALLATWIGSGVLNFQNFEFNLTNVAFIGLILGYEFVFFQYYLGSSIFSTIGKVFILLGPSVWFGSRVLNHLGELRLAGKR
jgi:oligosaccharyltransferase complex subunit delta (ribophorin II)